jgi:hypothetical protein
MRNSDVRHGYLVHLARPISDPQKVDEVEQVVNRLIKTEHDGIHIAYAQVDEDRKQTRYRRLGDPAIRSLASKS